MSETPALYQIDEEGSDTEKLAAIQNVQDRKDARLMGDMCEYLSEHLEWIKALTEDQATIILVDLVTKHPTAVQKLIDAQEQAEG